MAKIKEHSGYLDLRGFCIKIDFSLLEEIETILLRNIDLSNKYNRYKIELLPNKKNITKRYEFPNVENLKQDYKDIKDINDYDINISLYTDNNDVDVKIYFKTPVAYDILSVHGENVDLAYGKYYQLIDLLEAKKTFYWFMHTTQARIIISLLVCYGIPILIYCLKHSKLAFIWLVISIIIMFFSSDISEKIFPSRIIKLSNNIPWYKNQTILTWLGIIVPFIAIFVSVILHILPVKT